MTAAKVGSRGTPMEPERTSERDVASGSNRRRLAWWRAASLAPLAAGALAWFASAGFRDVLGRGATLLAHGDVEGLRALGDELGPAAALVTTLLMIVQALAAPIPAVVVTATNSLLFGPFVGGTLSIASATLAALLCFALARSFGEPFVARVVPAQRRARYESFLAEHGAATILAARLFPFVPFDPISYLAGLSRMRPWSFVWATFAGQIPAGYAYSYLARDAAASSGRPLHVAMQIALGLAALTVLGWSARKLLLRRRESP